MRTWNGYCADTTLLNTTDSHIFSMEIPECRKWPSALSCFAPTSYTHRRRKAWNPWSGLFPYADQSFLIWAFSSAKNSSMGLKSSEYGGRYSNLTPASAHKVLIRSEWWNDALSITSTDFGSGHLPQCWRSCSINDSKKAASVEPLKIRDIMIPSWAYAGSIWKRWPRWNFETWTGVTPSGDQPVRLYNDNPAARIAALDVASIMFGHFSVNSEVEIGLSCGEITRWWGDKASKVYVAIIVE